MSVRVIQNAGARITRVFDTALAIVVVTALFTMLNLGRMPSGVDDFLTQRLSVKNVALLLVFCYCWQLSFDMCGLYRPHAWPRRHFLLRIVLACTLATSLLIVFPFASNSGAFGWLVILYFWLAAMALELAGRSAFEAARRYMRSRRQKRVQAVIVGSGPRALTLYHALQESDRSGCDIVGFIDSPNGHEVPAAIRERIVSSLPGFETYISTHAVDQVLIALPVRSYYEDIQAIIGVCERVGVEARYSHDVFSVSLARHDVEIDGTHSVVTLKTVVDDHRLAVKRALDLLGAACGLAALSPVLLGCAIAVKLSGPGPVLFAQHRYGLNRRTFRMYKFRTMVADAETLQAALESRNEASGPVFKIRADPRVTSIGRVMRRLSLDELPQLFNVLLGDMSLVGPRPLPVRDVSRFTEAWLMRRFSVKPGLTCLWQINGRSDADFDKWVRLDLDYIDNWSLTLDMRILIKTVPVVLSGSGAV